MGDARHNRLGQPIGPSLEGWIARELPAREVMKGRFCALEPLEPARHAAELWAAVSRDPGGGLFTYLPYGPFESASAYRAWLESSCLGNDPLYFAIIESAGGCAVGLAAYQRAAPQAGVIEVAHLQFSPELQQTAASTEAMYLMMKRTFSELGYRRYEWKCDSLNAPSRRAAERLGFTFEGIFRQHVIYKGRSRDTAWYSILDSEWPAAERAFQAWLEPSNFDAAGRQIRSLASLR